MTEQAHEHDSELIEEAQESLDVLKDLVCELTEHTTRLRTEIAVLTELIVQERARREGT